MPTGSHSLAGFDRDTQIGTGSTDLLIGGYHRGAFDVGQKWGWFVQGAGELPIASQGDYKPGGEVNAAAGVVYAGVSLAGGRLMLTPVMQLITSVRGKDSGAASDPNNIGYRRLILAPGLQINGRKWKVYGDVEIPLAQSFNGRQLASPEQFKVILSRDF